MATDKKLSNPARRITRFEALFDTPSDLRPLGQFWQVRVQYDVRVEAGYRRTLTRIRPTGHVRRRWAPADQPRLLQDWLLPLRGADDDKIIEWVRFNGLLGITPHDQPEGEFLERIRAEIHRVGAVFDLWNALENRETPRDWLREATRRVGSTAVPVVPLRRRSIPDPLAHDRNAALAVLGQAIGYGLRGRVDVFPWPFAAEERLALDPGLLPHGPLASGYVHLLNLVTAFEVEQVAMVGPVHWKQPRPCVRCGSEFRPRRRLQLYCSNRCNQAAYKARTRTTRRTTKAADSGGTARTETVGGELNGR